MIIPEHLTLRNYCQHSSFELDFPDGTTAIVGPNGSGKTSIYSGIVYALTGWCDPAWGSQKELQKDGEALPGFAELIFTVEGTQDTYVVRRYTLAGGKYIDTLTKNSELVASKRQKVNDQLESIVGLPCNLLAQLMWARQEALTWLLTCPPAGVNQVLAQLFDCSKIEKVRDIIKKACDKIPLLRSDFNDKALSASKILKELPDIAQLETILEDSKKQLKELVAESVKLAESVYITSSEKEQSLSTVRRTIEILTSRLKQLPVVNKPNSDIRNTESEVVSSQLHVLSDIKDVCFKLDQKLITLNELSELRAPTGCCAYCGHTLVDPDKYISNSVNKITGGKFDDLDEAVRQLNQEVIQLSKDKETLQQRKDKLEDLLQSIRANIIEWQAYDHYIRELEKNNQIQDNINKCQEELAELEAIPVSDDFGARRDLVFKQIDAVESCIKDLEAQIVKAKTDKEYAEHLLKEAVADKKAYTRNETVRLMLTDIRASMSQSRGQAIFLNSKIDALNNQISDYMLLTDMPFSLWLDKEEHLFKYKMNDDQAVEHSAAKLSGAQKAIASLVIQLALINTCNVQCRLLLFDEVDAALSPENKSAVVALQRSLLADSSFKLLFITQSEQLTDSCDNVVTLN